MTDYAQRETKVAIFITHMHMGGAQRAMLTLAEGLNDRGFDVVLVLVRAEGEFMEQIPADVDVVDLDAGRVLTAIRPLTGYLRDETPDSLISTITVTNLVAAWATMLARTDTQLILRESVVFSRHTASYSPLKRRLIPLLVRYTYRRADQIVGVTTEVREDIGERTGAPDSRLHTIYNNIDVEHIRERGVEAPDHPWLDDGEYDVILGAGRLSYQKDFANLIRAFAQVAEDRACRLIIIGEGPDRPGLEALAADLGVTDRVSMPGYEDNPYGFMGAADVFVLSSRWEGIGNVLLEAMACGTPVVSTDCGTAEIVGDGERGPLVPVEDPTALAAGIESAIDDPIDGSVLREWVETHCSSMVEQFAALLRSAEDANES